MPESTPADVAVVLLAAGASSRMGRPKALLPIDGTTLVERTLGAALASGAWPVILVLGHAAVEIGRATARLPVLRIQNSEWERGMGTSIQCGIEAANRFSPSLSGVLIALCDQPGFNADVVSRLADAWPGPSGIAAARYGGAIGAPALFGRAFFPELLGLEPQRGAQVVLRRHAREVVAVDLPEMAIDLDTPAEYQAFLQRHSPA